MNSCSLQDRLNQSFENSKLRDKPAIDLGNKIITYEELDHRTNQIAHWIIDSGIKEETFIGALFENRSDFIFALIGILKARCVFVPLTPEHPIDRLKMMITSADIKWILSDVKCISMFSEDNAEEFIVDTAFILMNELIANKSTSSLPNSFQITYSPKDKIYIYFTSGTTGIPKAIIGKNSSVLHFIDWEIETFGIDETFRVSQFINPGFDAFLRDIFAPLCVGGTICIPAGKDILLNSLELIDWIDQTRINLIHCVPAFFRLFNSNGIHANLFKHLKYVLLSGERVEPVYLVNWYNTFDQRIQLVNLWGPSETTMIKTFYFLSKADLNKEIIPVGKPMKGSRVIVLNENMEVCKDRTVGELYIRTPHRTYGYYNDPQQNQERFIRNPFNDNPDDLVYKTGDLGRILPDDNIEVLGRIDRQVKIRGIRIEMEEIESVLLKHPSIKEAVVTKAEMTGDREFLYAYVTLKPDTATTETEEIQWNEESLSIALRSYLSGQLPTYMIPSHFLILETMLRNLNGKVNYKELPNPTHTQRRVYIDPRNDIEKKLQKLWAQTLNLEESTISVTEHFFQLGGNSIHIMSLISKIFREFNVKISLKDIFENWNIETQARIIKNDNSYRYDQIEISNKMGDCIIDAKIDSNTAHEDYSIPLHYFHVIENFISENFRNKAIYKNYQISNTSYRVLYIIPKENNTDELLESLKKNFKDFYPNFIKLIRSSNEVMIGEEIAPEVFSTMMGLSDPVTIPKSILEEFNKNSRFSHLLMKNNMLRKYQISPIQRFYLEISDSIKVNNILFFHDFNFPIEFEEIQKIVIKIINENSLLRSIVVKTDDNYYINEFASFSNIQLPVLDISHYSFDCKNNIQKILFQHFEKPFEIFNTILYRAIIIRLDNSHSKLIFIFNHLIFDGGSSLSLTKQVNAFEKDFHNPPGTKKVDYYDYSNFLHNLNYENIHLEKYLHIPDYLESVNNVYTSIKTNSFVDNIWEIDISILNKSSKDIYNEILLLSYAKLIRDLFGIDNVPILFYSYGRNYKDANFSNVIGDFHDTIPILFNLDSAKNINLKEYLENFLEYRAYVRDANLNFNNFILKKFQEKEIYLRLLFSPFSFNSQINSSDRYKYIASQRLSPPLPRERVKDTLFTFQMKTVKDLYSDSVFIRFMHNSVFDDHQLKEVFIKKFREVATCFNGSGSDEVS